MIPLSLEALQTREARRPRCREIARRHDTEARRRSLSFVSPDRPCVCLAAKDRLFNPSIELYVAPEVEAVSHMVDVTQDLRLRSVALGPMPFLLQLVREGIRVLHAFDVAATPRVTVPVPGAANAATGLEATHFEAEFTQAIDRVETADSGADDDRIKFCGFWGARRQLGSPANIGGYQGPPPLFTTERVTRPPRALCLRIVT